MLILGIFFSSPDSQAQIRKYTSLGYRSCGTGQGNCHQSDGDWWKTDPHYSTVSDLKRKSQKAMQMAQAYGIPASDYLKGSTVCAECHGEVMSGRENRNINTGVSCESCHGPSGPKGVGYFEIHQEGTNPGDPLDTSRSGYQNALLVGLLELRNVNARAKMCVECHRINDKKLLEAGHPSGDGFDYVKGIRNNISRHWDYPIRAVDTDEKPYTDALQAKPIPQFTSKPLVPAAAPAAAISADVSTDLPPRASTPTPPAPKQAVRRERTVSKPARAMPATPPSAPVVIRVDPELPAWLNPKSTVVIKPFDPKLSENAPIDSILIEIKKYIEYVHQTINQK